MGFFLMASLNSFIFSMKTSGPERILCGIAYFLKLPSVAIIPFLTHGFILVRYGFSKDLVLCSKIKTIFLMMSEDDETKCFAKFKKIVTTISFSSRKWLSFSVGANISWRYDFFMETELILLTMTFLSKCSVWCSRRSLWKVFANAGVTEIGP